MKIIQRSKDKYMLVRIGKTRSRIVKILMEYDDDKKATKALTDLMLGETTEDELLKKYKECE